MQSFLAATSTQSYFLIARMLIFFVTFATKVPYLTFCDKMRQFLIWKWIEREEIKRNWGNVESKYLSISSFSLYFLFIFFYSLSISSSFFYSLSIFLPPSCQAETSFATLDVILDNIAIALWTMFLR